MRTFGKLISFAQLALLISGLLASEVAWARSAFKDRAAWADVNTDALPNEIRNRVKALQGACGDRIAATHFFARPVSNGRFMVLHYEALWCPKPGFVCKNDTCLHEVYKLSGRSYKRVFSGFVNDEALFPGNSGLSLNLKTELQWDGKRFLPVR